MTPRLTQTLRPYQQLAVDDAIALIQGASYADPVRELYAAPTGTGKGTIELALQDALRELGLACGILTPSLEVLRGYIERRGAGQGVLFEETGAEKLARLGQDIDVWTPVRFRNRVLEGVAPEFDVIIIDEAHHNVGANVVAGDLFAALPMTHFIGFTATAFRGTPKETLALRDEWGEVCEILSIPDAIEGGWMALPEASVVPILDDDLVSVRGGKFVLHELEAQTGSRIDALVDLIAGQGTSHQCADGTYWYADAPVMVSLPSTDMVHAVADRLEERHGIEAVWILQSTKTKDRAAAYEACRATVAPLLQINVVNEGGSRC